MTSTWYLFFIVALVIFTLRKDLRREMIWAGLLAIPVLIILPLISPQYFMTASKEGGVFFFVFEQLLFSFSFGAVAAALYESILHKRLSPYTNPHRKMLFSLLIGPLVFFILFLLKQPFIISLLAGLIVNIFILIIIRRDLFWDVLFSGTGMGILYVILFTFGFPHIPGDITHFWFTDSVSGVTFLNFPIEELITVILFGGLWGPIYCAIKGLREQPSDAYFSVQAYAPKVILSRIILFFSASFLVWFVHQFLFVPRVVSASASESHTLGGLKTPLRIQFDRPIERTTLSVTITPEVPTLLQFEDPIAGSHLYRTVTIQPEGYFEPDKEYHVTVNNIQNILGVGGNSYSYSFQTDPLPTVTNVAIDDQNQQACTPITVSLNKPLIPNLNYNFSTNPEALLTSEYNPKTQSYTITPVSCFKQNTAYTLKIQPVVSDTENIPPLLKLKEETVSFHTKSAPGIQAYQPEGDMVLVSTKQLEVVFSQTMDHEEVLKRITLSPAIGGDWLWESDTKLVYNLNSPLEFATAYTITVPEGIKDQSGGYIEAAITVSFRSIGNVTVSAVSPTNEAREANSASTVAVTFNQDVDHSSAESAFSLSPDTPGRLNWKSNQLVFTPHESLKKDTTYTIRVNSGIKSINGLDSNKSYTYTFTTQTSLTLISVAVDYQDKALSCEAAALKMALSAKGLFVSEQNIMDQVGYDPTVRNGNIWGDPEVAFVGSINGKQNTSGYGVHWQPIARAASALGRNSRAFSNIGPSDLAREISQNNPVIIWGVLGSASYDPWYTPGGKLIKAWKGEHTRTVVGFKGSVESPSHFILNDPIAGRMTWTTAQLRSNWATFDNSGVVIY